MAGNFVVRILVDEGAIGDIRLGRIGYLKHIDREGNACFFAIGGGLGPARKEAGLQSQVFIELIENAQRYRSGAHLAGHRVFEIPPGGIVGVFRRRIDGDAVRAVHVRSCVDVGFGVVGKQPDHDRGSGSVTVFAQFFALDQPWVVDTNVLAGNGIAVFLDLAGGGQLHGVDHGRIDVDTTTCLDHRGAPDFRGRIVAVLGKAGRRRKAAFE